MAESPPKRKRAESVACEPMSPDGDLILAIGEPAQRVLRVSSSVLTNASSFFKAMLSGQFREGLASRSKEAPFKLPLPEDNPSGMAHMCALLHHNMETILDSLWATRRIYYLASTIDKYDCTTTLQLQCRALMLQFFDNHSFPEVSEREYLINDHRESQDVEARRS